MAELSRSIALKLVVEQPGSTAVRRVRQDVVTLQGIRETVGRWVDGSYTIAYDDDEGDRVVMDTEDEFDECIRQWHNSGSAETLRLYVSVSPAGFPAASPACIPVRPIPLPVPAYKSSTRHVPRTDGSSSPEWPLVRNILMRKGGNDVVESLRSRAITPADIECADWLRIQPNGELDFSLRRLAETLELWGMAANSNRDYAGAATWFEVLSNLQPTNCYAPLNCSAALCQQGSLDRSLLFLRMALNRGYTDLEAVANNPDFVGLADNNEFHGLVGTVPKRPKLAGNLADDGAMAEMSSQEQDANHTEVTEGDEGCGVEDIQAAEEEMQNAGEEERIEDDEATGEVDELTDFDLNMKVVQYAEQLDKLHHLGLHNDRSLVAMLDKAKGEVQTVIDEVLQR